MADDTTTGAKAPSGKGSGVKPPEAAADKPRISFDYARLQEDLRGVLAQIERVMLAKASSYTSAISAVEAQKADRAHLMAALATIREKHLAVAATEHPGVGGGLYIGEVDIERAYGQAMRAAGLFMLPNVVQAIGPDSSGNVMVTVEYAIADRDGRLWPAAVRVFGMGNDRVATQRGGAGDKALPRALSAAYIEAVCRLMGVAIERHDAEQHDKAHEVPAAPARPSNQRTREPALSLAAEDDFKDRVIAKLEECETLAAIDKLMGHSKTTEMMARVGSRTRKAIEDVEKEVRRRCDAGRSGLTGGDDRGAGRRDDERRREPEDRGRGYAGDMGGREPYNDPDDDIPF